MGTPGKRWDGAAGRPAVEGPEAGPEILEVLGFFHLVVGALACMLASIPLLALALPQFESWALDGPAQLSTPPQGLAVTVYLVGAVAGLVYGGAMALAGASLLQRRRLALCRFMAAVSLILFPVGTALGWVTRRALVRPEVVSAFRSAAQRGATSEGAES